MALTLNMADQNPTTGVSATGVKPITDGEQYTVVADETESKFGWGALDDLYGAVAKGANTIIDAYANKEADKISGAPGKDSTGNVADNPGSIQPDVEQSFIEENKTALIIGAGLLVLVVAVIATRGR